MGGIEEEVGGGYSEINGIAIRATRMPIAWKRVKRSFRIDEQDVSRADAERHAAEESSRDALPVCFLFSD